MAILDQFGRPLETAALREPQTSSLAALRQEFAEHPASKLTPPRLAAILRDAEQGDWAAQCDLFEDMEDRDGHVLAEMGKRKRALLTLSWNVQPPRNASAAEKTQAAMAKELLQDVPEFEDLLLDLADGIGKGFSCVELEWLRLGKAWTIKKASHRPQRWFQTDRASRTEIRLRDTSAGPDGAELRPFGWMTHRHTAKSGYFARSGLYRTLSWPFMFKWWAARDIAEFLEIYGLPLRVGTYPSGVGEEEKRTLLRAVVGIGHAAAGIIPEGMMIDFKEAAKGTHEPFAFWIDWCERTQSKAILGQTLSAEAKATGLGSGVANLQAEVRQDIRDSDALQIAGTITRDLVYPLMVLNGASIEDARRCPKFVFDTAEAEDLALYAENLPKLVQAGLEIPLIYVYERLRIPQPANGEAVLRVAQPAPSSAPNDRSAPQQAAARRLAALRAGTSAEDAPSVQADVLAELARPALRGMIEQVQAIVEQALSLEELRDALLAAYGELPAGELAAVMELAFSAAQLAGEYEVAGGD